MEEMTNVVFVVSPAALMCAEPAGGERGIFSNRVCKQTLLIAFHSLLAARRKKKGRIPVSFTSRGERDAFPQGNDQGSNWGEESSVRRMMTNAPGAHHLSCRVNRGTKYFEFGPMPHLLQSLPVTHREYTPFKLGVLK